VTLADIGYPVYALSITSSHSL